MYAVPDMATSGSPLKLPPQEEPDKPPPPYTPDGIYTLIGDHPSTPDSTGSPSQAPHTRQPQRDGFGYSSVHKPKKKNDQPNRSKTFSGRKTPPTVRTLAEPRAQSTAPSHFNEKYSDVNITLTDLVDKYYERFPVLIRVTQGVCGKDERVTLSSLDCFKVHFLKHVNIVNITSSSGDPFSVPQSSVLKFGLVYKPDAGPSNGTDGVKFSKVSEILSSQPCPKLICVEEAWSSADGKVSLAASEVLAVLKAKKKKLLRKRSLLVYSYASNTEKVIPEECVARFTTKPDSVSLHLPDIMDHVPDLFPCDAYIFVSDACKPESELPEALLTSAVRLNGTAKESSLVAAPATFGGSPTAVPENSSFVEIPLDLKNVTLSVIETTSVVETEQLYDDTRHVIENFNPSMLSKTQESETLNTQQVLYSSLRRGYETIGMKIEVPPAIKGAEHHGETPPPPPPPTPPPVPSRVSSGTTESLLSTPSTTKQGEFFHFPVDKDVGSTPSLNCSPMRPHDMSAVCEDTSPSSGCLSSANPRPPMPLPGTENGRSFSLGDAGDISDKEGSFVADGLAKSGSEASWHNEIGLAKLSELQHTVRALDGRVHAVEMTRANSSEISELRVTVESLALRVEAIEKLLDAKHGASVNGFCNPVSPPSPPSPSSVEQNLQYLKTLDCSKVSVHV